MRYIIIAKDEIVNRNISRANIKAREASAKADESYPDALRRQRILTPYC